MILIRLIWTCEKDEFELGAMRELKACHKVGGYCRKEALAWCVEKRGPAGISRELGGWGFGIAAGRRERRFGVSNWSQTGGGALVLRRCSSVRLPVSRSLQADGDADQPPDLR